RAAPRSTRLPYTTLFRSDLDAVVLKAMAKNPANRYQSAEELARDLHRFRTGQAVEATPVLSMGATAAMERPAGTAVLPATAAERSEEHTSALQSRVDLVC